MQDIHAFDQLTAALRKFFRDQRGYLEVPAQARRSILAACEDPKTIAEYVFGGIKGPLPQTGQMWLEFELLQNPDWPGVFCSTTSYRNEPCPTPGRHEKVFPMFEFEGRGTIEDLRRTERELLDHLGFDPPVTTTYDEACGVYGVQILEEEHETRLHEDLGSSVSLELFPHRTEPFWNMKRAPSGLYNKVDVLLYGMETIGSAERSTSVEEMRRDFHTVSDGEYAETLFKAFGRERVLAELDEFLGMDMVPRYGAGIGMTRLARAWKLHNEQG